MITFDLMSGLQILVPGAKIQGTFINHTQSEYDALKWLDPRDKPSYIEVETASLNEMRQQCRNMINDNTDIMIENNMIFDDVDVTLGIKEQINILGMLSIAFLGKFLNQDLFEQAGIKFPYKLKVSDNEDGEGNYITLQNIEHFYQFFLKGVNHKNFNIESGRLLKDTLGSLNRTQLEEFRDKR